LLRFHMMDVQAKDIGAACPTDDRGMANIIKIFFKSNAPNTSRNKIFSFRVLRDTSFRFDD